MDRQGVGEFEFAFDIGRGSSSRPTVGCVENWTFIESALPLPLRGLHDEADLAVGDVIQPFALRVGCLPAVDRLHHLVGPDDLLLAERLHALPLRVVEHPAPVLRLNLAVDLGRAVLVVAHRAEDLPTLGLHRVVRLRVFSESEAGVERDVRLLVVGQLQMLPHAQRQAVASSWLPSRQ